MTSLNASSTYGPLRGAALVSGTFWKRWGVSSAGTLEAETVRGPLIIWAKPAAKEEAPKLEDPQPTPLEGRVIGLNTAAHFARFFFAARRKVRHSIRWKTGRKLKERFITKQIVVNGHVLDRLLERYPYLAHFASYHEMTVSDYIFTDVTLWLEANRFTLKMFSKSMKKAIAIEKIEDRQLEARRRWSHANSSNEPIKKEMSEEEREKWLIEDELHNEKVMRTLESLENGNLPDIQDILDIAKDNKESLLGLAPYFNPRFNDISTKTYIDFLGFCVN